MRLYPATDGPADPAEAHPASMQTVDHRQFSWRPLTTTALSRTDRLQRCRVMRILSCGLTAVCHPTPSNCQTSHSRVAVVAPTVRWRARLLRKPSCPPPLLPP